MQAWTRTVVRMSVPGGVGGLPRPLTTSSQVIGLCLLTCARGNILSGGERCGIPSDRSARKPLGAWKVRRRRVKVWSQVLSLVLGLRNPRRMVSIIHHIVAYVQLAR